MNLFKKIMRYFVMYGFRRTLAKSLYKIDGAELIIAGERSDEIMNLYRKVRKYNIPWPSFSRINNEVYERG